MDQNLFPSGKEADFKRHVQCQNPESDKRNFSGNNVDWKYIVCYWNMCVLIVKLVEMHNKC